jgi:hypothetical protein
LFSESGLGKRRHFEKGQRKVSEAQQPWNGGGDETDRRDHQTRSNPSNIAVFNRLRNGDPDARVHLIVNDALARSGVFFFFFCFFFLLYFEKETH